MKKNLFIILLIMIILPLRVEAEEGLGKLNISCSSSTALAGETFKCFISGSSDLDIIDVSAVINLSDNLILSSFELDESWDGYDIDDGKIDIYTKSAEPIKGQFNIGTFNISVKNNIVNKNETVSLTSIMFYYDDREDSLKDATTSIRIPNNVNTLKTLEIEGLSLSPKFDKDKTNYKISTISKSINITAVSTDSKAKIEGTGIHELKDGTNNLEIKVTAEDGTTKTYNIEVIANLSNDEDNTSNNNNDDNNDNKPGDNKEDNNGTSNKNDKTDEEITENEKTGDISIVTICIFGLLSFFALVYYFKKRNVSVNKI